MRARGPRLGLIALVSTAALALTGMVLVRNGDVDEPRHAHGSAPAGKVIGTPSRHIGPQGRVGQFVVLCAYSHSAAADPIVAPGQPGRSHQHDFFGATGTDAHSEASDLLDDPTTCDKRKDTAAYWQPTLYDAGEPVEPVHLYAYYRAAPGVDPTLVEPFPFGLELIAGDPTSAGPTDDEAAGWVCGSATRLEVEPPTCPRSAPLHMVLTFPDCWDGEHRRTEDHRSHAAYSTDGGCPETHPVHVPQLTVAVKYPVSGAGHDLTLASGSVHSAHGDFLNAWHEEALEREVLNCIRRDVVCDLASNRAEEPLFAAG